MIRHIKGKLKRIGNALIRDRYDGAICTDCSTVFYVERGIVMCNGGRIFRCPWCKIG